MPSDRTFVRWLGVAMTALYCGLLAYSLHARVAEVTARFGPLDPFETAMVWALYAAAVALFVGLTWRFFLRRRDR